MSILVILLTAAPRLVGALLFLVGLASPPTPDPGARAHQGSAARHLLAYLEGRRDEDLTKAEEHLSLIPLDAADEGPDDVDRLVLFPLEQESMFLRRVTIWLRGGANWSEMPQFDALLRYLSKNDHRLLKLHLAEVAQAVSPRVALNALGPIDSDKMSTSLLIRTLRPERWDFEHKLILRFVGLRPGEHVADIGSGGGFFTFRFSPIVGPEGRVYAVDVSQRALDVVESVGDETRFRNVTTSLSTWTTNQLEDDSVDVVFVSNILFDVENLPSDKKTEFYASIKRILRPGGRFVACDHSNTVGGMPHDEAVLRIRAAGFTVVESNAWPAICIKARELVTAPAIPRSPDTHPR